MTAEICEERGIFKSQHMKAEDKALTIKCGLQIYSEDASQAQTGWTEQNFLDSKTNTEIETCLQKTVLNFWV